MPRSGVENTKRRDIVVIGGSVGGLKPLAILLSEMPVELRAAFFVVMHDATSIWSTNDLIQVLQRETQMSVVSACDQKRPEAGMVYICPADHHLTIDDGLMRLDKAPKEHHTRPSIDVLFRSSARTYGRRVVGVLLSGFLQDGVAGLWQIKERGGAVLVQDPDEAEYPGMPNSAIASVPIDCVAPVRQLAEELVCLLNGSTETEETKSRTVLIVEDEGLVARNLRERLNEAGYRVCGPASTGEEAVRLAAEESPDLILMDIRLQGEMSGVQAARAIWEAQQIPIVFVTANADASTLEDLKTVPNYGYVAKPLHSASVQAVVELALDRRKKELRQALGPDLASS